MTNVPFREFQLVAHLIRILRLAWEALIEPSTKAVVWFPCSFSFRSIYDSFSSRLINGKRKRNIQFNDCENKHTLITSVVKWFIRIFLFTIFYLLFYRFARQFFRNWARVLRNLRSDPKIGVAYVKYVKGITR